MNKIWFTADTHFGHRNVISHDKRPFKAANCTCVPETPTERGHVCQACTDEMDRVLIDNWNSLVSKNDDVWHLGDFCFRSQKSAAWYLSQLNGRVHIVWGNHDDQGPNCAWKHREHFASFQDYKYLKLNGHKTTLFHYKAEVWRASGRASWHLFGHSHGNIRPKVAVDKIQASRDRIMEILQPKSGFPSKLSDDLKNAAVKQILDELATPVYGKWLDVGVMNHGFKPLSYEQIEAYMQDKGLTDHHSDIEA